MDLSGISEVILLKLSYVMTKLLKKYFVKCESFVLEFENLDVDGVSCRKDFSID